MTDRAPQTSGFSMEDARRVLARLDRAHRMSSSDPDDPSRHTTYSEARDALAGALAHIDELTDPAPPVAP